MIDKIFLFQGIKRSFSIGVIVLFCYFQLNAQENRKLMYTDFNLQKLDIFHHFGVIGSIYENFFIDAGLGYGMNRSFVMNTFNYSINAGGGFWFEITQKLKFAPSILYSYKYYKLSEETALNYHFVGGGYNLTFGNKLKLLHSARVGFENELNSTIQTQQKVRFINYHFNIGLAYEL